MTKKDYDLIVEVLRDSTLHLQDAKKRALAARFADRLIADNPRFDRDKFITAVMS